MFFKLLIIIFFILCQPLKSFSQILNFTYNGFYPPLTNISTEGIANITPKGLLQLTCMTSKETGHAFYNKPIRFKDSPSGNVSSFSTTFVFAIYSHIPIFGGHGLAFVIAPNPCLQYLGLFNSTNNVNDTNHIVAITLDTSVSSHAGYWNEKHQFKQLGLISHTRRQVWLDYDGCTHRINVTMASFGMDKPKTPLMSIARDLSSILLQDMYVGFSSATGNLMSEHNVLGWSFGVKGEAPPLVLSKLPKLPEMEPRRLYDFFKHKMPWISLLIVFFLVFLVGCIVRRRRKFAEELEDWETEFIKKRLKFKDLYYATKGFKDKYLLGSGGFGRVYKGVMPKTKKEIAVKRVWNQSRQGLKEFVSEIVSMGRMSHRNLVPLLGYCRWRNELLLVYDYMPNGCLDSYLHNCSKVTLDWKLRIKVINGVASALFFLHEEWEQVVIHRDIKASNVLLDAEFNGRLGDFGLARLCVHGSNPQTTHVAGTLGYLAPDHIRTGRATTATDVFSFGVLLLEVVCGKRPIEIQNESGDPVMLVDWVLGLWMDGNILDARDPKLRLTEYDLREVEMVLKLGLMCSHSDPHARPTMRQVLQYLRGDAMLPDLSTLDLHGNGMVLEFQRGFSEYLSIVTDGSSIVDSILSGGR